jgi:hypothetical protein
MVRTTIVWGLSNRFVRPAMVLLPPTVVSQLAAAEGLGMSLFERLMPRYGPTAARRLTVQYRMHTQIMDFSSLEFFEAELTADDSVADHLLCELPGVAATPLVVRKVRLLLDSGVAPQDTAVIAPYAAQVRLLRSELPITGLEIDSVDGFQGREQGSRRDLAGPLEPGRRDRLSGRHPPDERGLDPRAAQTAGRRRHVHARPPSLLPPADRVFRIAGGLPDGVGGRLRRPNKPLIFHVIFHLINRMSGQQAQSLVDD